MPNNLSHIGVVVEDPMLQQHIVRKMGVPKTDESIMPLKKRFHVLQQSVRGC